MYLHMHLPSGDNSSSISSSTLFHEVQVGAAPMPLNMKHNLYARVMPNYDLPGNDYNVTNVKYTGQ